MMDQSSLSRLGMADRCIRREEGLNMKRTQIMGASLVVLVLMGALTATGGQMPMGSQEGA